MAAGCKWRKDYSKPASWWPAIAPLIQEHPERWANAEVEWVYELFITTLEADGFLVEDVLDGYPGRGAEDRSPGF
jgi:hypothetical protein